MRRNQPTKSRFSMRAPWRSSLWAARLLGHLSRLLGRGGGTTAPGRLLLALRPEAVERLAGGLADGSILVSATNGKTTTSAMIGAILETANRPPVHNRAGSNMHWGIATALATQTGQEGLFEIDEAWLPRVAPELKPRLIVLGNLFRDQLDRYGELESISEGWRDLVADLPSDCRLALCADDPRVADLGSRTDPSAVTYFGVEDEAVSVPGRRHASDPMRCPSCQREFRYSGYFIGHLGHYSCPGCGLARPRPDVAATRVSLNGMDGSELQVRCPDGVLDLHLPLPGLYNVYNALAAVCAGVEMGVPLETIERALTDVSAAFGRVERIGIGGKELWILLIKNPAGANEVIRTLSEEAARSGPLDLWIALNDGIADGRDVSWIWDADFEDLAEVIRHVQCSGARAPEMALRLKYAGWPDERIAVDPVIETALDAALASAEGRLYALPTYTALLEMRRLLAGRGEADDYWG